MKGKRFNKTILLATALLTIPFSCKESELELVDPNIIVADTFFQNQTELESAVFSAYSFLQAQGMYGRAAFFMFDNLSQENIGTDALLGDLRELFEYTFTASNGQLFLYWQAAYRGISSANFVIDAADQGLIQNVPQNTINEVVGEARFLRALYYFYLTNLWGDVPLLSTQAVDANGTPKSAQADVYALILEDLTFAKANLPAVGSTQDGRATSGAAQTLKGKVHLYLEQWQEARDEFATLTGYSIAGIPHSDVANIAGEFNAESIFEVNFSREIGGGPWNPTGNGLSETTFRALEYSSLGFGNIQVNPNLLAEFEVDDTRLATSFYFDGDPYGPAFPDGGDSPCGDGAVSAPDADGNVRRLRDQPAVEWRKFQNLDVLCQEDFAYSGINFRIMRYADVLLMWAEAENELGNVGNAVNLMNQVRDRAGMPNYGTPEMDGRGFPVTNQQQVFDAIVHERAVELAGEQIRYFDLQRWGIASQVVDGFQTGRHELLPIPQQELDSNPQLSNDDQNPGY